MSVEDRKRPRGISSRVVLAAFALVCGAAFVFSLATWEQTAAASTRLRGVLLFGAPMMAVLALVARSRFSNRGRLAFCAALIVCFTGVITAEILLASVWFWRAREHLPFDARDRVQVTLDLQADGIPAVPSIEPKGLLVPEPDGSLRARTTDRGSELQALGGVANRYTVVCNETGTWISYTSDRYGMHNPDWVWDVSNASLAAVGDAFANGWCADSKSHFIGLLRRARPAVVNLGQSGNGPLLTLASIVEYLPALRPETVLWFHYELNDLDDLSTELRSPLLRKYLTEGFQQALVERQDAIDREIGTLIREHESFWRHGNLQVGDFSVTGAPGFLRGLLKLPRARLFLGLTYGDDAAAYDYGMFEKALTRARDTVRGWDGTLRLVYLPAASRYVTLAGRGGRHEVDRIRLREIARRLEVDVVDVHESFETHGRPLAFFNPIAGGTYGHYTTEGHRLVADLIRERLAQ